MEKIFEDLFRAAGVGGTIEIAVVCIGLVVFLYGLIAPKKVFGIIEKDDWTLKTQLIVCSVGVLMITAALFLLAHIRIMPPAEPPPIAPTPALKDQPDPNVVMTERARIRTDNAGFGAFEIGKSIQVRLDYQNYGRGPALNVEHAHFNLELWDVGRPSIFMAKDHLEALALQCLSSSVTGNNDTLPPASPERLEIDCGLSGSDYRGADRCMRPPLAPTNILAAAITGCFTYQTVFKTIGHTFYCYYFDPNQAGIDRSKLPRCPGGYQED
jgi:hypothetical protein